MKGKYIIFGVGKNGMEVYSHMQKGEIAFFCDNNTEKVGKEIDGIEIISFQKLLEIHQNYIIILSIGNKYAVRKQFELNGITNYIEYQDDFIKGNNTPNNDIQYVMKPQNPLNELLITYLNMCEEVDPLSSFYDFRKLVSDCKKELKGGYAFFESAYNESMLYGHAKAIMDYAEIELDYANFPIVAHGPFYAGTHPDFHSAAIFSGCYDKNIHNNRYPYIPIFSVGPYIQYAKAVYSETDLYEIKRRNRKTAVFFITHSTEQTFVTCDEKQILNQIIEVYSKKYDTIYVCAYWCDIDKNIYSELEKNGIKVISAGFRFDSKFIHRLRTIMELGDDIFVYGFTSAVIYALNLKKNLYVFNCNETFEMNNTPKYIPVIRLEDTDEYRYLTNTLFTNSDGGKKELSEKEKDVFNQYFGLHISKTAEEIRMIYDVCRDIWDNCAHLEKEYPIGVYRTYQQYQKDYNFEKLAILSQGLGRGFWNI